MRCSYYRWDPEYRNGAALGARHIPTHCKTTRGWGTCCSWVFHDDSRRPGEGRWSCSILTLAAAACKHLQRRLEWNRRKRNIVCNYPVAGWLCVRSHECLSLWTASYVNFRKTWPKSSFWYANTFLKNTNQVHIRSPGHVQGHGSIKGGYVYCLGYNFDFSV